MITRIILVFVLLGATAAWSQVEPGASGGASDQSDTEMQTPPPVNGKAYPNAGSGETHSNYLSTTIGVTGAYIDNVLPGEGGTPINDGTISVVPGFSLSRTTPRLEVTVSYSPSFLFYEPTSSLDTINHGAGFSIQDRISPHVSLSLNDSFSKSSNVFDQSYVFSQGTVTGAPQTAAVIAPWAELINNTAGGVLSYQFGRDAMVGGGGSFSTVNYPGPTSGAVIPSSNGGGATAFYNRRLTRTEYFGFSYSFNRTGAEYGLLQSETQTHSFLPFLTIYFSKAFSLSVAAGVQRVGVSLPGSITSTSWAPAGDVSLGWQTRRASFAANYSRTVSSGAGLFGAFNSNSVSASGNWQLTRYWTLGVSGSYSDTTNATPNISTYAGGTTIAAQASLSRTFRERLSAGFGYQRIHEDYSEYSIIADNPDSDQVYGRVAYAFRIPIRK